MTNAPALIVHYRRFTLVIAILLAGQLCVAAIGISIELHQSQAGLALILSPQILVLFAAYLAKTACDRWANSAICLTVSAEGLMLPGLIERPIPWTAVKSVRGVCCSPAPELAAIPRHYMMFDVEAPETFGARQPGAIQPLMAPRPADAPLVTLDLSELDTGKEAILDAVRRFHPAAVTDPVADRPPAAASLAKDASIRFPSLQEIRQGASRLRADTAWLITHRRHVWPVLVAESQHSAGLVRAQFAEQFDAAARWRRSARASVRHQVRVLRYRVKSTIARTTEHVRAATLDLRQRLDRGRQMNNR